MGLITLASGLTALAPLFLKRIVDGFTGPLRGGGASQTLALMLYVASQWGARSVTELRGLTYARAERRMMRTLSERPLRPYSSVTFEFHLNRETGALTQSISQGPVGYQIILHTLAFSLLPVIIEMGTSVAVLARLGQASYLMR